MVRKCHWAAQTAFQPEYLRRHIRRTNPTQPAVFLHGLPGLAAQQGPDCISPNTDSRSVAERRLQFFATPAVQSLFADRSGGCERTDYLRSAALSQQSDS